MPLSSPQRTARSIRPILPRALLALCCTLSAPQFALAAGQAAATAQPAAPVAAQSTSTAPSSTEPTATRPKTPQPIATTAPIASDVRKLPAPPTALQDDAARYLAALGQLDAHLHVAIELYRDDRPKLAATHIDATDSALYRDLGPALAAHGRPDLSKPLAHFGQLVASGADLGAVEGAYADLSFALRADLEEMAANPRAMFEAMAYLSGRAAADYAQGVPEDRVTDAPAYRRAWGLMRTVGDMADLMMGASTDKADHAAFLAISALGRANDAFLGLVQTEPIEATPGLLATIAGQITAASQTLD